MSRASAQDTPSALLRTVWLIWAQSAGTTAISRRSLEARRRCGAWSSTGFDTVSDAMGKPPYQGTRGNQWASVRRTLHCGLVRREERPREVGFLMCADKSCVWKLAQDAMVSADEYCTGPVLARGRRSARQGDLAAADDGRGARHAVELGCTGEPLATFGGGERRRRRRPREMPACRASRRPRSECAI